MEALYMKIVEVFSILFSAMIFVIYFYNAYLVFKYLQLNKKTRTRLIRTLSLLVSLSMGATFGYIFYSAVCGGSFYASPLAIMLIRPLIFLTGCIVASNSYIRLRETEEVCKKLWTYLK